MIGCHESSAPFWHAPRLLDCGRCAAARSQGVASQIACHAPALGRPSRRCTETPVLRAKIVNLGRDRWNDGQPSEQKSLRRPDFSRLAARLGIAETARAVRSHVPIGDVQMSVQRNANDRAGRAHRVPTHVERKGRSDRQGADLDSSLRTLRALRSSSSWCVRKQCFPNVTGELQPAATE